MDKYDNVLEGKVIVVNGFYFDNNKLDHAWNTGRMCLVLFADDEYEYVLPISHKCHPNYIYEHTKINNGDFKIYYNKRYKEKVMFRKNKYNSTNPKDVDGYVKLTTIYPIPLAFRDEIGKLKLEKYKEVINSIKLFHKVETNEELLEKAIFKK